MVREDSGGDGIMKGMSANFGWDYPPGVTGNEYAIAGPDYDQEKEGVCPKCGDTGCLSEQGYRGQRWVVCCSCDYQEDLEDETNT